jgi:hypothetical protein
MTELDDIKTTIKKLRALAVRADAAARSLKGSNHAVMVAAGTAMASLAQISVAARDFFNAVEMHFEALPAELKQRLT